MIETTLFPIAQKWSGALRRELLARPNFGMQLLKSSKRPVTSEVIDQWLQQYASTHNIAPTLDEVKQQLRLTRKHVFYTLLVRDCAGACPLDEVTEAMSYLADSAVKLAYQAAYHHLAERHGVPQHPQNGEALELLILAMGKWGGKELNVSSDIDLICLYSHDGDTTGPRPLSHHEFFARVTQQICRIIADFDADGYVFRCDLRLRPDGNAGPIAWSIGAVENYLIQQGREWERYAWLKARALHVYTHSAHNAKLLRQQFERLRTPFVYRKYFDFNAIQALRELRERIRQDWDRRVLDKHSPETRHNIKLGDGGIREIEFIVQLNQLIRGGRLPSLRQCNLLNAINAQQHAGVLDSSVCAELKEAYRFLRRVEHMLQYREDAQTHLLPTDEASRQQLAHCLQLSLPAFEAQCQAHRAVVEKNFQAAFHIAGLQEPPSKQLSTTPKVVDDTALEPFHHDAQQQFDEFLNSQRFQRLSARSQRHLQQLLPLLAEAAALQPNPEICLRRLLNVIESITQRSVYVTLLIEYPQILQRLSTIVAASPWAAQYLAQYPLVLDGLIEWNSLMEDIDFSALKVQLATELDACLLPDGSYDIEQQMNLMRDTQHQVTFELIAQDLSGLHTVEALADRLSALADLLLEESLRRTWPLAQARNNPAPYAEPTFAIIAYGKLGGKELGYASDLDLVFLYEDNDEHAIERYVRLGRRMVSWLSTLTSSGRLYEVDMRLRPDGDAGLIATSFDSFANYQKNNAWSWEHQALTRARFVAGDVGIGAKFEALRQDILLRERDIEQLKVDILTMRERIRQGHPNHSELFDLKHDRGGMVDIEFITQYLVLAHAHQYPMLLNNLGNITLLQLSAQFGLIDTTLSETVVAAYRQYRKLQHALRLQAQSWARVPPAQHQNEREAVEALWKSVLTR